MDFSLCKRFPVTEWLPSKGQFGFDIDFAVRLIQQHQKKTKGFDNDQ